MTRSTADLYDLYGEQVRVASPMFINYGAKRIFSGPISTVKVHEDNSLVRQALEEPGEGRVLVVDGGGSLRCALLGDRLASLAGDNHWEGVVVHGCIRDCAAISGMPIGVKAMGTNPRKSARKGAGDRDVPVTFAGIIFRPSAYLYADDDGILVADQKLD